MRARVAVEAGIAMPWYRFVGDAGEIVSIEHYGASAGYEVLYEVRVTTAAVVEAAQRSVTNANVTGDTAGDKRGETMSTNERLAELSEAGVSVWLDDLSRDLLRSGRLAELIATRSVVGVTTNPSIFQAALSAGDSYAEQVAKLAADGSDVDTAIRIITTDDVRDACDVFARSSSNPTVSTVGCRSRSTRAWPTTPRHRRPGDRAVAGRRPTQPAHQDPGHQGGPAAITRVPRRGASAST